MKIRNYSEIEKFYADTHPIDRTSPDVRFIDAVCAEDNDAVLSLFAEKKLFGNVPPVIDAPFGRFEGLNGIFDFIKVWNSSFGADSSFAVPCIQTISGGRAALEVSINFTVDGEINQIPMFVVCEFRTKSMLDEVRIYCYYTMVPGMTPYRAPMFVSAHPEMGDPGLLTGAVREYYEALHHCPAVDVDKILGAMNDEIFMGGYGYFDPNRNYVLTREDERKAFTGMSAYIPKAIMMRYETIIDDGRTCVIEWMYVVSKLGREEHCRYAMSHISAYERGDNGKLSSIRIMDYAHHEREIDWNLTALSQEEAAKINYIDEITPGCGAKKQYDM